MAVTSKTESHSKNIAFDIVTIRQQVLLLLSTRTKVLKLNQLIRKRQHNLEWTTTGQVHVNEP